jgi:hypothetical protein
MRVLSDYFPAVEQRRQAERVARLARDIERLRGIADSRPNLQIQITCSGRLDGAGGQALSVISALAFADNHHCRYLHTPFRGVSHVKGDPESWTRQWEIFFGFGEGEASVPADAEIMPVRRFARLCRRAPSYVPAQRLVVQAESFGYGEFSKRDMTRLTPRLRAKYHSSDKSAIPLHRMAGGGQYRDPCAQGRCPGRLLPLHARCADPRHDRPAARGLRIAGNGRGIPCLFRRYGRRLPAIQRSRLPASP